MLRRLVLLFPAIALLASCQKETQVEKANRDGILIVGNSAEPKSLDLHLVTGVIESKILTALYEGLVAFDASSDDATPPAAATSWEHNTDMTEWTFHLQPKGRWSDGVPVTARDFVFAYHRGLHPDLGGPYAEMLYFLTNGEIYNKNERGKILVNANVVPGVNWDAVKNFAFAPDKSSNIDDLGKAAAWKDAKTDGQRKRFVKNKGLDALGADTLQWILGDPAGRYSWPEGADPAIAKSLLEVMAARASEDLFALANVGVTAVDDLTLTVKLREPVPYLPSLTRHYTWFPAPEHVILKYGKMAARDNKWFMTELVGNGPFKMKEWRFHDFIEVERNPNYWDAATVRLNGIRFLPIENSFTETRAFLSGQLHTTYQLPPDLIKTMKKQAPESLRQEPYLATTFLRFNVNKPALSDARVRQALSLAIERGPICDYISEGFKPATSFTPDMGSYQPERVLGFDPEKARRLLAEAGYPKGDKFPRYSILTARSSTRPVLEAVQAMWRKHLNIIVDIDNKDWGSYVAAQQNLDYEIAAASWVGDYLDPSTFLGMWTKGNGNNNTGWDSPDFEAMLRDAAMQADPARRFAIFRTAESLLMKEQPVLPISWWVRNYLHRPEVKGWYPLVLDHHPWKMVRIEK